MRAGAMRSAATALRPERIPRLHLPARMPWPTPTSSDCKRGAYTNDNHDKGRPRLSLVGAARLGTYADPTNRAAIDRAREMPGWLNPEWVEWLMGYPVGWTE